MTVRGSCHCGSVKFEVVLVDGLNTARRCNCSICRMRGAVAVSALIEDLKITSGEEKLTLYQFNTREAKHFFCSICGIYTHHQRRSNPREFGINIACLEGLSPFDIEEVKVLNGNEHLNDVKGERQVVVGILKFERR
jgi:hypothetical protein